VLCAALAADLDAADLRSEPLRAAWGAEADDALARGIRSPLLRAIEGRTDALATLGRLFVLGMPQPEADVAAALARTGVDLGGYISFSGILTFPKSEELRAIAKTIPHDRLLVETDAPYLAPKRWRGKRNEPSYVVNTAEVLAETIGVSVEDIAAITTENAFRCFSKMPRI